MANHCQHEPCLFAVMNPSDHDILYEEKVANSSINDLEIGEEYVGEFQ